MSQSRSLAKYWLIAGSIFFYAWWDIAFVPIILGSIAFNYYLGSRILVSKSRSVLVSGISINLLLIAVYKYSDFAIHTVNMLTNSGYDYLNLALPLAISFFTFQQIAYLVDAYQGKVEDNTGTNYLLFVLFFPQLIAGPIVHHSEMLPQYQSLKRWKEIMNDHLIHGVILIIVGLFKKIVIADTLAAWVTPAFVDPGSLSMLDAWTGILAYTFQIYFDFSAYSEMAMGFALLFGIKLPLNFDSPYQSRNISEFWRKWHITLGRFLRMYLYIPLGGSKKGPLVAVVALTVTMLLGGLWHGAGWNFVLWGAIHGLLLSIVFLWGRVGFDLGRPFSVAITFISVVLAWVPFRANSVSDAILYWKALFDFSNLHPQTFHAAILKDILSDEVAVGISFYDGWEIIALLLLLYAVVKYPNIHYYLRSFRPAIKNYAYLSLMAIASISIMGRPSAFIYWGF